jgi:AcrR family transcriptional regulator
MKSNASDDRHTRALELRLFHNKTYGEIAQELGVTERTIYYWFSEPEMRAVIEHHRTGKLSNLVDQALDVTREAFEVMRDVMNNTAVAPAVRLQAARHVAEIMFRLYETQGFAERLARLEDQLRQRLPGS